VNDESRPQAAVESPAKATDPSKPIFDGAWTSSSRRPRGPRSRMILLSLQAASQAVVCEAKGQTVHMRLCRILAAGDPA
jgi:hypothetical protein